MRSSVSQNSQTNCWTLNTVKYPTPLHPENFRAGPVTHTLMYEKKNEKKNIKLSLSHPKVNREI